ncbi:cryptochrome DASH [Lingula anatina]|uniref:Cryptochrome DASH n=1 Tax=Lingula anatina TaxID=7574 RepID=A0A1S3JD95_LINAN|nr:cryptochrome DASH [Lingula anatina]|eukprot:XP_013407859.1 cryptochrome DASH [Lingula anatina]
MSGTAMKTVICLIRNDLRLHDNELLHWAYSHLQASHVLPLYCFDPRHFAGTYHFGFPKTGAHRLQFLLESVDDLRKSLKARGSNLIIRQGKPEDVVPAIIKCLGQGNVIAVGFQEEATQEELDVEAALKKNCGVQIKTFWGSTLYHKEDVPFKIQHVPDVYTQFRKAVEGQSSVRKLLEIPEQLKPPPPDLEEGEMPTMQTFGMQGEVKDERSAFPFCGGETEALSRLKHYLWDSDSVAKYKETRNGMVGADYSTKFSTWLAHGSISPRKIFWEIKRYEKERTANQSTYWVIFELIWRDYFKFVALKYGTRLFFLDGIMGKKIQWKQDPKLFQAWKTGNTGVPYVDANMREMAATGFMSNRGRQNVASFLTKDLHLDWRMGAEWFESCLIDHDVCSNYGNWQYAAGIGNDPREDRKFNMVKQGMDYDPEGEYVRLWVPELSEIKGGNVHTPWALSKALLSKARVNIGETYPHPIVIAKEWAKHVGRQSDSRGRAPSGKGRQRGIDFYFKNPSKP